VEPQRYEDGGVDYEVGHEEEPECPGHFQQINKIEI